MQFFKNLVSILAAGALALGLLALPAVASQGSLCMPLVSPVSGLTFAQDVNAATAALVSANSGAVAPANPCGAAPVKGQFWLDTSTTPAVLKIYDGSSTWTPLGQLDAVNHLWEPPIGGNTGTIVGAATTDLSTVNASFVTISGSVGITSFGSAMPVGTSKLIKFSSTPTITYNATSMILPTAASITAAAGDTAIVTALGSGNFIVTDYIRADGTPVGQITSANILNATITGADIAATTITGSNIAANTVAPSNLSLSIFSSGQLQLSTSTVMKLMPYKGNLVSFPSGTVATIPSAGVSATVTSMFVNGTGATALTASTLYYVYLFMNSGTPTLDASTTGHATDTTTGLEIKSGDTTRVLVGMVYPAAGPTILDSLTNRLVATWNNRRPRQMLNNFTTSRTTSSGTYTEINSEIRLNFLCWGDAIQVAYMGDAFSTTGSDETFSAPSVDSAITSGNFIPTGTNGSSAQPQNISVSGPLTPSEGFHYLTIMGRIGASTAHWNVNGSGISAGLTLNVSS